MFRARLSVFESCSVSPADDLPPKLMLHHVVILGVDDVFVRDDLSEVGAKFNVQARLGRRSSFVEDPMPDGPYGAKGVGEIGLVPTAGAVANALYKFDGKRRTSLPMKDSPAAKALSVGR